MEQLGLTEELLPTAMEMGKINGTLYGVVKNFWLETVVASPDLKDWDYDTFFQCIQDRPELEAICDYYGGNGMNDLFSSSSKPSMDESSSTGPFPAVSCVSSAVLSS